ncbi:lysophospholipid acyltransferase family protein [Rhodobacter capsulatus]|uniref:lysophospholipid acyltransferase family protein n=1 Tax=Rhodobacter capsulatus TaxID=1061 RepID=UPI0003D36308|nr:lysophospholipid acyltransferase family protein [Rhodobacter capsulatus]ETD83705.1 glycerol acyltransferase [Rhodobacter capsulatus YW1]ETD88881.1 glycerol acyltransferase [Rhodobacter capsulatus YW2]
MIVWQYIRSVLFIAQMYVMLAVYAIVGLPYALIGGRSAAIRVCRGYCKWVCWTAGWMVGIKTEYRGEIPTGDVLIAAKHQSFFDILMIYAAIPRGKFIMKKELVWTPFVGWYAWMIGCVPVDRGKRGAAIKGMLEQAKDARFAGGQLVIFAQGTRVAAGAKKPYKIGAGALYNELGLPCVPAATNVGVFWPRHAVLRKPGLAVVEFLPQIAPGMAMGEYMKVIEAQIETASDKLMAEAGLKIG